MDMRKFSVLAVADLSFALLAAGQEKRDLADIRQIDFRNFGYPWRTATTQGDFEWLTKFDTTVSLRDGAHVFESDDCGGSYGRCPAVSISEVLHRRK
jgi:hypothetical protein